MLDAIFTNGAQPLEFAPLQFFRAYQWQAYVYSGVGHWPLSEMHYVTAPSNALSRGKPYPTQSAVLQPFQQYGVTYSFGAWQSHPIPLPSLHGREGSYFPVLAQPDDIVDSVVGVQPGDSGVGDWVSG